MFKMKRFLGVCVLMVSIVSCGSDPPTDIRREPTPIEFTDDAADWTVELSDEDADWASSVATIHDLGRANATTVFYEAICNDSVAFAYMNFIDFTTGAIDAVLLGLMTTDDLVELFEWLAADSNKTFTAGCTVEHLEEMGRAANDAAVAVGSVMGG